MYAESIRDKDARECDPSQRVSHKRRKARMRGAMTDRRKPARETDECPLFRLQEGAY